MTRDEILKHLPDGPALRKICEEAAVLAREDSVLCLWFLRQVKRLVLDIRQRRVAPPVLEPDWGALETINDFLRCSTGAMLAPGFEATWRDHLDLYFIDHFWSLVHQLPAYRSACAPVPERLMKFVEAELDVRLKPGRVLDAFGRLPFSRVASVPAAPPRQDCSVQW